MRRIVWKLWSDPRTGKEVRIALYIDSQSGQLILDAALVNSCASESSTLPIPGRKKVANTAKKRLDNGRRRR